MSNSHAVLNHKLQMPKWSGQREKAPNILVLDTCTMLMLSSPIPQEMFSSKTPTDHRPHTYLDLLGMLPRSVVSEIHIPDIVVSEATYRSYAPLYDGTLNETVAKDRRNTHSKKIAEWHPHGRSEQEILNFTGVGSARLLDVGMPVKIVHFKQCQDYFHKIVDLGQMIEFVKSVKCLDQKHPEWHMRIEKHAAPIKKSENCFEIVDRLTAHHALENKNDYEQAKEQLPKYITEKGADLGELICAQYALDYAAKNKSTVTMLTEDHYGHEMLSKNLANFVHRKDIDIYNTDFYGLMQALQESGLLAKAGLKDKLCAKDLTRAAQDYKNHTKNSNVYVTDQMESSAFATRVMMSRTDDAQKLYL